MTTTPQQFPPLTPEAASFTLAIGTPVAAGDPRRNAGILPALPTTTPSTSNNPHPTQPQCQNSEPSIKESLLYCQLIYQEITKPNPNIADILNKFELTESEFFTLLDSPNFNRYVRLMAWNHCYNKQRQRDNSTITSLQDLGVTLHDPATSVTGKLQAATKIIYLLHDMEPPAPRPPRSYIPRPRKPRITTPSIAAGAPQITSPQRRNAGVSPALVTNSATSSNHSQLPTKTSDTPELIPTYVLPTSTIQQLETPTTETPTNFPPETPTFTPHKNFPYPQVIDQAYFKTIDPQPPTEITEEPDQNSNTQNEFAEFLKNIETLKQNLKSKTAQPNFQNSEFCTLNSPPNTS